MLDIKLLREEPEKVKRGIAAKGAKPEIVDEFWELDGRWRKLTAELDNLRREQKELSGERDIDAARGVKEKIKLKEEESAALEKERIAVWLKIPNMPSGDTPVGKDESANKILRVWGEPKKFSANGGSASGGDFEPKDHLALGEMLGLIDVKKAAEVSGSRFGYLKGDAVFLEFALAQYGLNVLTDENILKKIAADITSGYSAKPFLPVIPPVLIKPDVFQKMARLEPEEERYYIPRDDLYLVGSAEHTLGPLHMDETVKEDDLPLRYVGFSTAFRRESGSYGKDVRGILRVHQFDKLEMESFTTSENSTSEQDFFVAIQEYLMQSLELPYQVVMCSTGDQGDSDARHIDIETWMPGQGKYRETHSADMMTDYQARRLNTKYKRRDGGTEFVHMNDATVFAVGRTLIAILENYQTKEGKVRIPKVLQKYVGKEIIG